MKDQPSLFDIPIINRNETFDKVIRPELTKRQKDVLETLIKLRLATMHDVADEMNVPLNTISGRFGELVKKHKIIPIKRIDRKTIYGVL